MRREIKRQLLIESSKPALLEALKGKKLSCVTGETPTTREIKQQVIIESPPKAVFEALMDDKKHAQFTGAAATIGRKAGSPFRCYGNYIAGITLELEPARLIVQAWRSRNWPKETYSIVTFKLAKIAGDKTRLSFTQIGVPANDYREKNNGWRTHYWEPLKKYLKN